MKNVWECLKIKWNIWLQINEWKKIGRSSKENYIEIYKKQRKHEWVKKK